MQGIVTPTAGAAAGTASTGMAGLLDRLADDLTFTLDRKAETEQGECAFQCVLVSLSASFLLPVVDIPPVLGFLLLPGHFLRVPFASETRMIACLHFS